MVASAFFIATTVSGTSIGRTMVDVKAGAGGIPGGGGSAVPTIGQIWPRGNWT